MLKLKNLHKKYTTKDGIKVEALRDVSLMLPSSGLVFIVGKSGSGKSTMLNILGMLDKFDGGDYIIDGKSSKNFTQKERDNFRALNIGFVFQEFHIIEKYSIGQNISLPLEIQHKKFTKAEIKEALKKVGLEGFENRSPAEISGGQKQRVAVARAIIKNPKIILADEPTGSLDSQNGKEIFNLLKGLSKDKLVIIITHDMENANRYADEIIELADGKIKNKFAPSGITETIKLQVDEIDDLSVAKINEMLSENKKIVLSKKTMQEDVTFKEESNKIIDERKKSKVKLPFKSTIKLSLYSLRRKWLRTFFTILIAMFAIAFFGFADMVGQFSVDKVLLSELNSENKGYVNIGAQLVKEDGIFTSYTPTYFYDDLINEFDKQGIEHINKYVFQSYITFPFVDYKEYFKETERRGQYYSKTVLGVIECDNLAKLGLTLAEGKMPENNNEIIITSYMLEAFKEFGFSDENWQEIDVQSFADIEGQKFRIDYETEYYTGKKYTIVGLIDFDLSQFAPLANVHSYIANISDEQNELLSLARRAKSDVLNFFFTLPGFYEEFSNNHANMQLRTTNLTHKDVTTTLSNIAGLKLSDKVFDFAQNFIFKDNFTADDLSSSQIIVNRRLIMQLYSDDDLELFNNLSAISDLENFLADPTIDFWNSTLKLSIAQQIAEDFAFSDIETTFNIVGVLIDDEWRDYPLYIASPEFYDNYHVHVTNSLIISANGETERARLVEVISKMENITIGENIYRFAISSTNSWQIYYLNTYFKLFINIFQILAIIFCVFSIILTYTFISQSIVARKKDIGILRSLGARKLDIAGIFLIEGVLIFILEIILGALTCYGGYVALDYYFISKMGYLAENYTIISFGVRQVLLITLASFVAVCSSVGIPIIRISNKEPVDSIRTS